MRGKLIYYVYILFRPWNWLPCYVGKGKDNRWLHHERKGAKHENIHLARIIAKAKGPLPKIKFKEGLSERHALRLEIKLIGLIGRGKNGPLVNLTDGGDGQSGWVPSKVTRKRISVANTGNKHSLKTKLAMSKAGKGRRKSKAHRKAIGTALKDKQVSAATRQKQSMAQKKRYQKFEEHEKLKSYFRNLTPEQKAERSRNISYRTKLAMKRPEVRKRYLIGLVSRNG